MSFSNYHSLVLLLCPLNLLCDEFKFDWHSIHPNGNRHWQKSFSTISMNDNLAVCIGGKDASSTIVQLSFNNIILNDDFTQIKSHDIQSKQLSWDYPNMTVDSDTTWESNNSLIEAWTSSGYTTAKGLTYITDSHYDDLVSGDIGLTYSGMLVYDIDTNKYISPNTYQYSLPHISQETCMLNNITHIFVIGGNEMVLDTWYQERKTTQYLQIYNVKYDTWSIGPNSEYIKKLSACTFDADYNFIYSMGGFGDNKVIEKYDLYSTQQWDTTSIYKSCKGDTIKISLISGSDQWFMAIKFNGTCCYGIANAWIKDHGNRANWTQHSEGYEETTHTYTRYHWQSYGDPFVAPISIKIATRYGETKIFNDFLIDYTNDVELDTGVNFDCTKTDNSQYWQILEATLTVARARLQCILNKFNGFIYCIGGTITKEWNADIQLSSIDILDTNTDTVTNISNPFQILTYATYYGTFLYELSNTIQILFLWNEYGMEYTIFKDLNSNNISYIAESINTNYTYETNYTIQVNITTDSVNATTDEIINIILDEFNDQLSVSSNTSYKLHVDVISIEEKDDGSFSIIIKIIIDSDNESPLDSDQIIIISNDLEDKLGDDADVDIEEEEEKEPVTSGGDSEPDDDAKTQTETEITLIIVICVIISLLIIIVFLLIWILYKKHKRKNYSIDQENIDKDGPKKTEMTTKTSNGYIRQIENDEPISPEFAPGSPTNNSIAPMNGITELKVNKDGINDDDEKDDDDDLYSEHQGPLTIGNDTAGAILKDGDSDDNDGNDDKDEDMYTGQNDDIITPNSPGNDANTLE